MSMTVHNSVKEVLIFIVTENNLTFRNIKKNFFQSLILLISLSKADIIRYLTILFQKNVYSENLELTYDLIQSKYN